MLGLFQRGIQTSACAQVKAICWLQPELHTSALFSLWGIRLGELCPI